MERVEKLYASIDALDPFSEEYNAFKTTILGGSVQLPFDGEGRVMLPEALLKPAKIADRALFVGKGATFEIWDPDAFEVYAAKAREVALSSRQMLRSVRGGES